MINAANANTHLLYTLFEKQLAQAQSMPQAEINADKESGAAKSAVPFSSSAQSSNTISDQTFSTLLSISSAGQTTESKLRAIANKYDVTNISGNERIAMAQELRDSELISSGAMMVIVAPLSMNEDMNQKTDYLSVARNSFEQTSRMGSDEQFELQKQRLEILEGLDDFKAGKTIS